MTPEDYLAALQSERAMLAGQGRNTESVDAEIKRVTDTPVKRTAESVQARRATKRAV